MSEYIKNLEEFLKKHPSPSVKIVSTLVKGDISCIGPVPRMFGPLVHCHSDIYDEVISTIKINKFKAI